MNKVNMKIKETNIRTGEFYIYDSIERQKEIHENQSKKMLGFYFPFKDIENGDIIISEKLTN